MGSNQLCVAEDDVGLKGEVGEVKGRITNWRGTAKTRRKRLSYWGVHTVRRAGLAVRPAA